MKRTRTLALLTALVCLCVSLTACSPKEVLKSAILKTTTALGLRQETSDEDEVDDLSYATGGGDVTFPETMDTTASKLVSEVDGDTLYVAFNGIQNRSTDYFVAGSDSLPTHDKWFGVTYAEDKQIVIDSFAKLVADGVYEKDLFSDLKK